MKVVVTTSQKHLLTKPKSTISKTVTASRTPQGDKQYGRSKENRDIIQNSRERSMSIEKVPEKNLLQTKISNQILTTKNE
eukprot:UN04968